MAMMTPFNAPSAEIAEDVLYVYRAIRNFDRNHGRSTADPVHDPHGRLLSELTRDELLEVAGWCMLPEYHDAVSAEFWRRRNDGLEPTIEGGIG